MIHKILAGASLALAIVMLVATFATAQTPEPTIVEEIDINGNLYLQSFWEYPGIACVSASDYDYSWTVFAESQGAVIISIDGPIGLFDYSERDENGELLNGVLTHTAAWYLHEDGRVCISLTYELLEAAPNL